MADEPTDVGGGDTGPSPYDYLLSGLGACTTMTLRMYANRKQWPLEEVRVTLRHRRVHAKDCADCETEQGLVDEIQRELEIVGDELTSARSTGRSPARSRSGRARTSDPPSSCGARR